MVPRAGLSREPLSLKHTLLGLKYGAKVDKVLRGSRPPTLRTTQTPSFLNEALRPDARLRHAAPETRSPVPSLTGFMLLRGPGVPAPSSGDPSGALGRGDCPLVRVSVEPGVALAG